MWTAKQEEICDIFYDTYRVPIGCFSREGRLIKLYSETGRRQTTLYMADAAGILAKAEDRVSARLCFDDKGAAWCLIPFEDETITLGPVQTGHADAFPYEKIPEYSPKSLQKTVRCLISLLAGKDFPLTEEEYNTPQGQNARQMYRHDVGIDDLNAFDDIYDCVRHGDLEQLDILLKSGAFTDYQSKVISNLTEAATVFHFNLAKTYHTALEATAAINDLSALVGLYLTRMQRFKSIASYKAGTLQMLYNFTRFVRQYRKKGASPLVGQALVYIRNHLYTPVRVEEIAAHCNVSLSTLQHRFREETGQALTDRIRAEKTERACFFLKYTDLPCGDIAFKMGYCSQSHFISQFKKALGMTPGQYRAGMPG